MKSHPFEGVLKCHFSGKGSFPQTFPQVGNRLFFYIQRLPRVFHISTGSYYYILNIISILLREIRLRIYLLTRAWGDADGVLKRVGIGFGFRRVNFYLEELCH